MAVDRADIAAWIREATPAHLKLLSGMQRALGNAGETVLAHDRDWCRVYALYQQGFQFLVGEERERIKMQLLAKRAGMATLSDEEYEREMIDLGRQAVREIGDQELAAEVERRAARVLAPG